MRRDVLANLVVAACLTFFAYVDRLMGALEPLWVVWWFAVALFYHARLSL